MHSWTQRLSFVFVLASAAVAATPASASYASASYIGSPSATTSQKVARKYTEIPAQGFKFKALDKYGQVPVGGRGDGSELARFVDDSNEFVVYGFATPKVEADDESGKGGSRAAGARRKIESSIRYRGFREVSKTPTLDEKVEVDGIEAHRRRFEWTLERAVTAKKTVEDPVFLEIWSYPLSHVDAHFVYFGYEEFDKRWNSAIEKSGESFTQIERVVPEELDRSKRSYADQLKLAKQEAERTPGWKAIGTPSKRFVILTNAENAKFIKEVIKRLEVSRNLYEKDFPPPADFKAVSIIRICKNREEFHEFSGTSAGVAGYFNPGSIELVLYDDVETNRNSTYAVVSHEAFHQYCHFLFGQSEAHRWFDEGHGDYYGGMEVVGKRGFITPRMPAGLNRLDTIREMVKLGKTVPLAEHLNYSHGEWQAHGVPSYCQSWSIIYMLRQGMLRKVSRKVWEKEYADIIPNYVETLNKGFQDAYEAIRKDRVEKAKKRAEETGEEVESEAFVINRFMLDPREKEKIWKAAMDASWGKIDMKKFEKNWLEYVGKHLKQ